MKTLSALAALLFTTTAAIAQAPSAPPEPPKTFKFELDQNDLNGLAAAINELPKKIADPLLAKMNSQLQAQTAKKAEDQAPAAAADVPPKAKK